MSIRVHLLLLLICVTVLSVCGCAAPPVPPVPAVPPAPSSINAGSTTVVAVAPPAAKCCPKQTLWQFLGVDKLFKGAGGLLNRLRLRLSSRFPALEPPPPLTSLTDPANLAEDASPAQQEAAKAKAEKDKAGQKAKAISYLARLGCTSCQPGVEKALIAAMEDCFSVEVRLAAVRAFRKNSGNPCDTCGGNAKCCSPKVIAALRKLAYDKKPDGCFKEISPIVRREARIAISNCGNPPPQPKKPTKEGPTPTDVDKDKPAGEGPAGAEKSAQNSVLKKEATPTLAKAKLPTKNIVTKTEKTVPVEKTPALLPEKIAKVQRLPIVKQAKQLYPRSKITLATVNGEPIYKHEVYLKVQDQLQVEKLSTASDMQQLQNVLLKQELQRQIDQKLIAQQIKKNPIRRVSFVEGIKQHQHIQLTEQWLADNAKISQQVESAEIASFYQKNLSRYQAEGKRRWELVSAPRQKYSTKESATELLNYLRDKLQQKPTAAPANASLKDLEVLEFQWTARDEIRSRLIANALFLLEKGGISGVIEDDYGWHVVRPLEIRPGPATPLRNVQADIKEEILRNRRLHQEHELLKQLRVAAEIRYPKKELTARKQTNDRRAVARTTSPSRNRTYTKASEPRRLEKSQPKPLRAVKQLPEHSYPGSTYFSK